MAERIVSFEKPLDFTQIIFKQIDDVRRANSLEEYITAVDNLYDLMFSYGKGEERFQKEMQYDGTLIDLSNPFKPKIAPEKQREYYRQVFRALISLIHRSGFLPFKEIEGVISEFDMKVLKELEKKHGEKGNITEEDVERARLKVKGI